jgi:hypothetical protein
LGLFSVVTLLAHKLDAEAGLPVRQASWYRKTQHTFADALALVRQHLWPCSELLGMFSSNTNMVKVPRPFLLCRLTYKVELRSQRPASWSGQNGKKLAWSSRVWHPQSGRGNGKLHTAGGEALPSHAARPKRSTRLSAPISRIPEP